ncbi:alpha/beta fold hydrolase [Streptomyces parvulus]|uniref:Alpha/beta hydrolase n=1 Tax=Streptomyces parvulus TaxID=146923 RepID=A0A369V3Z5_9ACTN|nr:alpha/beta hydrolase [Streptomyces parvulus]RDD85279.1 alpha/beta hydrolase [Streptomyces parvulus]
MTDGWEYDLVPMTAGRVTEVLTYGSGTEGTLLVHGGTPGGAVPRKPFAKVCDDFGLRYVMAGRPGYGRSSSRPGRVMADIAEDISRVLDHLGIDTFISMGGSGGGGNVLACAALLPDRCRAAACVVSPAPIDAEGLDFYAGMGVENVEEWQLAERGRDVVGPWLESTVAEWGDISAERFVETYRGALPLVDQEIFTTDFGEAFISSLRKATSTGVEGWLEDDIALVTPWGFDLGAITTPVTVWAGKLDQMVSYEHSVWLARAIPGADLHVIAGHGHLSVQQAYLPDIVTDLLRKGSR